MATKRGRATKKIDKKNEIVLFRSSNSYIGMLYGVITVIVLFVLIFVGAKLIAKRSVGPTGMISDEAAKTTAAPTPGENNKMYTVDVGDSLWTISQKVYDNPYHWVDIAKANKIANADAIDTGMKLVLPQVTPIPAPVVISDNETNEQKITDNFYTVQKDDSLWDIAVRAYGDGYKWTDIAASNKLDNPNLIYPGNVFRIPR